MSPPNYYGMIGGVIIQNQIILAAAKHMSHNCVLTYYTQLVYIGIAG